jgi:hypothetical protein
MHERALETRESNCMPRASKHFFIPVVHSLPGAVGHVVAPELSSQEGRVRSRGTRGNTRAHIVNETLSGAVGHVAAPELTSSKR